MGKNRRKEVYVRRGGFPPGVRKLWVRYLLDGRDTIGLMGHYRIDVDYAEADAKRVPFVIRHEWTDAGGKRSREERVSRLPHTYKITAGAGAIMDALKVFVPVAE